jgi:hypothetical protein
MNDEYFMKRVDAYIIRSTREEIAIKEKNIALMKAEVDEMYEELKQILTHTAGT